MYWYRIRRKVWAGLLILIVGSIALPPLISSSYAWLGWPPLYVADMMTTAAGSANEMLFGALIASLVGFVFAAETAATQQQDEIRRIATGFLYETREIQARFKAANIIDGKTYAQFLASPIQIYSGSGLYFILQKEIYSLDKEIIDLILRVYPNIILFSQYQRDPKRSFYGRDFMERLKQIDEDLDRLIPLLVRASEQGM
ncbi:MAG: hypothetical protein WC683_07600 [bacterium]